MDRRIIAYVFIDYFISIALKLNDLPIMDFNIESIISSYSFLTQKIAQISFLMIEPLMK